jgi:hypothetical protein
VTANLRLFASFKSEVAEEGVLRCEAEISAMRELAIVAPCIHASAACWGAEYRCFHLRYEQISLVALQVFGSRELSKGWMRKPKVGFGDNPPCILLSEPSGYAVLYDWLLRLEHGIST